jgi:prolyl-tRNA editing enzyme YbaK/EbsC (Cys-tRNA(Pro) deacylase)
MAVQGFYVAGGRAAGAVGLTKRERDVMGDRLVDPMENALPMGDDAVARVRLALARAGHPDTILAYPAGTRTAADAAAAIGCEVAQIAKSIVFRAGERAVVVVTSGANRVDPVRAATALGVGLARADAAFVREATGFMVGGVAPVGHLTPPLMLLDADLLRLDPVWAAAGSPRHVFRTNAVELVRMTGAVVAAVAEG